jgi:hypothetical protein
MYELTQMDIEFGMRGAWLKGRLEGRQEGPRRAMDGALSSPSAYRWREWSLR